MANLISSVLVYDNTGEAVWFRPGDDVPAWAAEQITNPAAWDEVPEADDESGDFPEGDPSEEWTGKQLKAYADANQIDLGGATKKADIVAAIQQAPSA